MPGRSRTCALLYIASGSESGFGRKKRAAGDEGQVASHADDREKQRSDWPARSGMAG